jgi:hypothetical protein
VLSSTRFVEFQRDAVEGLRQPFAETAWTFEVREREDVEQLGAGSRTEGVESLPWAALEMATLPQG